MRDTRDMVVLINAEDRACRALARLIRAESVYCRILPADTEADHEALQAAAGVILCGGMTGTPDELPQLNALLEKKVPLLAFGDAALSLCLALGGSLGELSAEEGVRAVRFREGDPLCGELTACDRWMPVCRPMLPGETSEALAVSEAGVLGIHRLGAPVYGLAFAVEQNDPEGMTLLRSFCSAICGCTPWWSTQTFIQRAEEEIAEVADDGAAICAISGGVDSSVCAMLANMVLGQRLQCLFVDTGLMRKGEAEQVYSLFAGLGFNIRRIDAADVIVPALSGLTDPAEKERMVFANLRAILRREVSADPDVRVVLQGTNYSDSLKSEPPFPVDIQNARVRLIEPVRDLFKDEIRQAAEALGLPPEVCQRQPFPGSGLATRVRGEVTPEKLRVLREADAILREEIEAAGQQKRLKQYYAVLLDNPVPREAPWLIQLRATQSSQGATIAARLPTDLLERITERIETELPDVRRVFYDLTMSRKLVKEAN